MKLLFLLGTGVLLVLGLTGSGAFAAPKETCTGPISGIHRSVTVTGTCAVLPAGVTINGDRLLTTMQFSSGDSGR